MKQIRLLIIATAYLLCALFLPGTVTALELPAQPEQIRVAILKGAGSVTIDGDGLLALDETGRSAGLSFPVTARSERGLIDTGALSFRTLRISGIENVRVNGKSYRGSIELAVFNNSLVVINELPLEHYLAGVINSEISSTWPMEAIKVQAVIARTYAVAKRIERRRALYHLESTVMDQAYDGSDQEDSRAMRGVQETMGQVLTYNNRIIQAFYHANSGGRTEASENVWGMSLPYLKGVECQYGLTSPTSVWEASVPLSRIETAMRAAGHKVYGLTDILAGTRNNRGRLKTVTLVTERGSVTVPATKFRMSVGSTVIKSTNFTVRVDGNSAFFNGSGYGHGVGLCQYGAKQRALDGFTYTEILSYYYPGTKLGKLSDIVQ